MNKKYKCLRNKVTQQIRKENQDFNNNRIKEAECESELWKVANDVIKSNEKTSIKQYIEGEIIEDKFTMK